MKGVMLGRLPEARIIDLTHEIVVHLAGRGGLWLVRSFGYFPAGTVHARRWSTFRARHLPRDRRGYAARASYSSLPDNGLLSCPSSPVTRAPP